MKNLLSLNILASHLASLVLALSLSGYVLVASTATIFGADNRLMSIGLRSVIFSVSCVVLVIVLRHKVGLVKHWAWNVLVIFWIAYIMRLYFDTLLIDRVLSRPAYEYWVWAIGGSLIPMIAIMTNRLMKSERRFSFWVWCSVAFAGILILIAALVEFRSGLSLIPITGRIQLNTLNAISVGHIGGSIFLITAHRLLIGQPKYRSKMYDSVVVIVGCIGILLLVGSGSRGALVATSLAVTPLVLSGFRYKRYWIGMTVVIILIAGTIGSLNFLNENIGSVASDRFSRTADFSSDTAATERMRSFAHAWHLFAESPIIGSTLESSESGQYPHNVVLESFMATGVFGGIALISLLFAALIESWRIIVRPSHSQWIGMISIQYIVGAQFSGSISDNTIMWAWIAAVFAFRIGRRNSEYFNTIASRDANNDVENIRP